MLNLTPENVTQHSRIVTATCKGSSTPKKLRESEATLKLLEPRVPKDFISGAPFK